MANNWEKLVKYLNKKEGFYQVFADNRIEMIDRDKEIMATVLMYTYMKSIGDALYGMYFSKLYNDVKSREVVKRIAQKCFGVEIRTGAISLFFGDFNRLLENMVYKSGIWEAVQNES